jgi:hypothetical protein
MSKIFAFVLGFREDDDDPRYSIPQIVSADAVDLDEAVIKLDPTAAAYHGIELDDKGFPVKSSLEAWHRKHNPQLFE